MGLAERPRPDKSSIELCSFFSMVGAKVKLRHH